MIMFWAIRFLPKHFIDYQQSEENNLSADANTFVPSEQRMDSRFPVSQRGVQDKIPSRGTLRNSEVLARASSTEDAEWTEAAIDLRKMAP